MVFILASGQASKAIWVTVLLLTLSEVHISVSIHVPDDDQLCIPLLLGLDFMNAGQIVLKPHCRKYVMPGQKKFSFLKKSCEMLQWGHREARVNFYMTVMEDLKDKQSSTPLLEAQPELVWQLFQKWPLV